MLRHRTNASWLLILSTLLLAGCGSSEPSGSDSSRSANASGPNAAEEYRRIFAAIDPEVLDACNELNGLANLKAGLQESLDGESDNIQALVAASAMPRCDYGTDYSDGVGTLLPHLDDLRKLAAVLSAEAFRRGKSDDPAGAADCINALIGMAEHAAAAEPCIVGKFVGYSLLGKAEYTSRELLSRDMLDAAARSRVAANLLAIDQQNPLDARGGLVLEEQMIVTTLRNARHYDADLRLDFAKLPDSEREEAIAEVRSAIARMNEVWDHPDAANEMDQIAKGLSNPIAQYTVVIFPAFRKRVDECRSHLQKFHSSLK